MRGCVIRMRPRVTPLTVVFVKFVTAVTAPAQHRGRDRGECGDGPGSRTYRRTADARVAAARGAGRRRGRNRLGLVRRAAGQPCRCPRPEPRRLARGRRLPRRSRRAGRPRSQRRPPAVRRAGPQGDRHRLRGHHEHQRHPLLAPEPRQHRQEVHRPHRRRAGGQELHRGLTPARWVRRCGRSSRSWTTARCAGWCRSASRPRRSTTRCSRCSPASSPLHWPSERWVRSAQRWPIAGCGARPTVSASRRSPGCTSTTTRCCGPCARASCCWTRPVA